MTYYYNGELEYVGKKPRFLSYVRDVFRDAGFYERSFDHTICFFPDGVVFENYCDGDIQSELDRAVHRLYKAGFRMEGSVEFYGDYDGAFELSKDGHVLSYDSDDWAIHVADSDTLAEELRSRGFVVMGKGK